MAGSASAIAATPKARSWRLRRTNGTHFSAASGTGNSTLSVGSRPGSRARQPGTVASGPGQLPIRTGAEGSAGTRAALRPLLLALLAVLEPLPRYLAHAVALVFRRDLPGLIEIGRRQQAVGEQEVSEVAGMAALLPDEALQQLLIVGDRSLSA